MPITILPGFPTTPSSNGFQGTGLSPFGLFFANANTLYVADEGVQGLGADPNAGLQKWSLVNGTWQLDYVLQNGLDLDQPYAVVGYPSQYDPAVTGLRNLTGRVNADGTVALYAATATYSALDDPGADPNSLMAITDSLTATALPGGEAFATVIAPAYGQVVRGVALAPVAATVPEPGSAAARERLGRASGAPAGALRTPQIVMKPSPSVAPQRD